MTAPRRDIQVHLAPYLEPGETVRWSGRPLQGVAFQPMDVFLIPFSIVWASLAVFVIGQMLQKAEFVFPLMLVPLLFAGVGVYITVGRFAVDAWLRANIWYAVTDRRAIIVSEAFWTAVTSYDLDRLPALELVEGGDNRGSIRFREEPMYWHNPWNGVAARNGFYRIEGARGVFNLIRERPRRD